MIDIQEVIFHLISDFITFQTSTAMTQLHVKVAKCLDIPTPYGQRSYLSRFSVWYHQLSLSYPLVTCKQYNEGLRDGDLFLQEDTATGEKTVKIAKEHVPWIIFTVHVLLNSTSPTLIFEHLESLKVNGISMEMVKNILPWCISAMERASGGKWPELQKPREDLSYDEMMGLWGKIHNHHVNLERLNPSAEKAGLVFFGLYRDPKGDSYVIYFIDHTTQATICLPSFRPKRHHDFRDRLQRALKLFMRTNGQPKAFFFMNSCSGQNRWLADELRMALKKLDPFDPIVSIFFANKIDELPVKIAAAFYNLSCHLYSDYRTKRLMEQKQRPYKKSFLLVDLPRDAHHSETTKTFFPHNTTLPPKQTARFFTKHPKKEVSLSPSTSTKNTLYYMIFPGPSVNIRRYQSHTHFSSLDFADPRTIPSSIPQVSPPFPPMDQKDQAEITKLVEESFKFSLASREMPNYPGDLQMDTTCRNIIDHLSREHIKKMKEYTEKLEKMRPLPPGTKSALSRGRGRKRKRSSREPENLEVRTVKKVRFADEVEAEKRAEPKQETVCKPKKRGRGILTAIINFFVEPAKTAAT